MKYRLEAATCRDYSVSSRLEWLLPNGIGGYSMGTVAGSNTRRYHGLLVAATRPPTDRTVLLAAMEAYVNVKGQSQGLSTNQYVGAVHPQGYLSLESFECGLDHVSWIHAVEGERILRRVKAHPGENACTIEHVNLGAQAVQLTLRPLVCHKFYHDNFRVTDFYPQFLMFPEGQTVLSHGNLKLHIEHPDADRTPTTGWYYRFEHPREAERGLDPIDDLYCPCELRYTLSPGHSTVLVASTEPGVPPAGFLDEPDVAERDTLEMLKEAAGRYLVQADRKTVIAGYPWFTDWGRDTMIALPGLCLATGRVEWAKETLRGYASAMDRGLIPNRFPDHATEPEYNTADATLWFANVVYLCLKAAWEEGFAREALGWLKESFDWHVRGTHFGIGVDPADGLLRQGVPGIQLTWMDAKVGEWVVTPRHGKPVEVNGLWVNACRVIEWLCQELGGDASVYREAAERAETSFRAKFWKASLGHYLDTVEPDDGSLRPNQLIAMSLPFAPATGREAVKALEKVRAELLTPNGIRTLGPSEPGYHGRYSGTMLERDEAYHQGTAWPWLLGPYVSAVLRLTGDVAEARSALSSARLWLSSYGLGGIAEVFDGDPPQFPGGWPWQAWSVAEVLRGWMETEEAAKAVGLPGA